MKTIFDKSAKDELINRIQTVSEQNAARWGKMNVYQMLKHCIIWDEWMLGLNKPAYKQEFLGRIFGKMVLQKMIKDEAPLDKNIPTGKQFKPKAQTGNIKTEKEKWILLLNQYDNYDNPKFIHDFFGKMTKEQVGYLVYKHTDHHLRQFGA
jgi:Protein of unknown function (DUF1569)